MSILDRFFGAAGKVVLVTGGSRGIGEAIAAGFVEAGAKVYICSRNVNDCAETAVRLSRLGFCEAISADLSSDAGRQALLETFSGKEQKLDVLINNAGVVWAAPLADYPESGWDKVFDLNVKGLFFLIQSLVPMLEKAGTADAPARIINVGSMNAMRLPKHETYAYTASKAAVHHLSRHLADQLASRHVTVNVIAPGWFPSRMLKSSLEKQGEAAMSERVPLKRLTGDMDMAGAALFLASPAAAYLTGVVLPVDGGVSIMS